MTKALVVIRGLPNAKRAEISSSSVKRVAKTKVMKYVYKKFRMGLGIDGVWYPLFLKNLAHYSSH